jgi:hypothetical protein
LLLLLQQQQHLVLPSSTSGHYTAYIPPLAVRNVLVLEHVPQTYLLPDPRPTGTASPTTTSVALLRSRSRSSRQAVSQPASPQPRLVFLSNKNDTVVPPSTSIVVVAYVLESSPSPSLSIYKRARQTKPCRPLPTLLISLAPHSRYLGAIPRRPTLFDFVNRLPPDCNHWY